MTSVAPAPNGTGAWVNFNYHDNGTLRHITHNDLASTFAIGKDPNAMQRPSSYGVNGSPTFEVSYDGSGNIREIDGSQGGASFPYELQQYTYDGLSRLTRTDIDQGDEHEYSYDDFGNRIDIERNGVSDNVTTNSATNQVVSVGPKGVQYTPQGRVDWRPRSSTENEVIDYEWDELGMMTEMQTEVSEGTGPTWYHIYNADDERVLTLVNTTSGWEEHLTLRGVNGEVLREYSEVCPGGSGSTGCENPDDPEASGFGSPIRDIVYRGTNQVLMSFEGNGRQRHHFLDHLGSPFRVVEIEDQGGTWTTVEDVEYAFFPFGEQRQPVPEATNPSADPLRAGHRYTGHERDIGMENLLTDDLDYMHARYHSHLWGRFLSADPIGGSPLVPQSWNRYSYVQNIPTGLVDPRGLLSVRDPDDPHVDSICVTASGGPCTNTTGVQGLQNLIGASQYQNAGAHGGPLVTRRVSFREGVAIDAAAGAGGDYSSAESQLLQDVATIKASVDRMQTIAVLSTMLVGPGLAGGGGGVSPHAFAAMVGGKGLPSLVVALEANLSKTLPNPSFLGSAKALDKTIRGLGLEMSGSGTIERTGAVVGWVNKGGLRSYLHSSGEVVFVRDLTLVYRWFPF